MTSSIHVVYSIYVDMTIKHVCSIDGSNGTGSGGSFYDTASLNFPDYSEDDFSCCAATGRGNCEEGPVCDTDDCNIQNYNNPQEVSTHCNAFLYES